MFFRSEKGKLQASLGTMDGSKPDELRTNCTSRLPCFAPNPISQINTAKHSKRRFDREEKNPARPSPERNVGSGLVQQAAVMNHHRHRRAQKMKRRNGIQSGSIRRLREEVVNPGEDSIPTSQRSPSRDRYTRPRPINQNPLSRPPLRPSFGDVC